MAPTPTTARAEGLAIVAGEVVAIGAGAPAALHRRGHSRDRAARSGGHPAGVRRQPHPPGVRHRADPRGRPQPVPHTRGRRGRRCGQRRPGWRPRTGSSAGALTRTCSARSSVSNTVLERRRGRPPGVPPLLRRSCRAGLVRCALALGRGHGCGGVHRRHRVSSPMRPASRRATSWSFRPSTSVEAFLPPLSFDHRAESLYAVLLHMARAGFTSGQVQDLAPDAIELLEAIEATRDLPIRLRMSPWYMPGAPIEEVVPSGRTSGRARTPLDRRGRQAHDRRHDRQRHGLAA